MQRIKEKLKFNEVAISSLYIIIAWIIVFTLKAVQVSGYFPQNAMPIIAICIITGLQRGRVVGVLVSSVSLYLISSFGLIALLFWVLPYTIIGFASGCFRNSKYKKLVAIILLVTGFIFWWIVSNSAFFFMPFPIESLYNLYIGPQTYSFLLTSFISNLVPVGIYIGYKFIVTRT